MNPAHHGTKAGGSLPGRDPGAGQRALPPAPGPRHALRPVRGLRRGAGAAPRRGRRVLRRAAGRARRSGCPERPAPGVRRHDLEQAVLPLRRDALARGRPDPAAAARIAPPRPQQRVAAPQQLRHHLDAGQMGVSLVRRLGPRVPLHPARADRRRVRQAAARDADARVVHAPERPAAGLRMGVLRRQPAGARLGRLAGVPDRPQAARRRRRPRVPRARLPQADAELHLVGEPQGRPGPQRLSGRLPRPRQHRRVRPQRAAAHRRLHQPGRRHRLDGDVLPEPDAHRARARPAQPRLRGHRDQVLRALPLHRRGDDQHRRRGHRPVGRGGPVLLRRAEPVRRLDHPAQGALDGRPDPAVRGRDARARPAGASCRSSASASTGS